MFSSKKKILGEKTQKNAKIRAKKGHPLLHTTIQCAQNKPHMLVHTLLRLRSVRLRSDDAEADERLRVARVQLQHHQVQLLRLLHVPPGGHDS